MNIVKTLFDSTVDLFTLDNPFPAPESTDTITLYTVPDSDVKIMSLLNVKKYGAYVAGGAALRWYQGLPVQTHDIDIWFPNNTRMQEMKNSLMSRYVLRFTSNNADTYEVNVDGKLYRVQLINPQGESTIEEIIDKFDITVCQIATDGLRWWTSPDFVQDVKNKRLRFVKHTPKTARRLVKYWTYGFNPDGSCLEAIMNDPQILWNYESSNNDDYENVI